VDRQKLLKAIYESLQWDRLYELAPDADRGQIDELFRTMREAAPAAEMDHDSTSSRNGLHTLDVRCDGASKGNPGPAGIGVVISTPEGEEILAWGEGIGRATNNVAEYRAAIAGLNQALELGASRVRLLSDSELLIHQITGRYRVKNAGLKPLHAEITSLLGRFDDWEAEYVPREQNQQADALADRAAADSARRERPRK
jgi:ribonuclease HI